jgi:hypothetical protein
VLFERVGVRLCRARGEHLRVEAQCDTDGVPVGGKVSCGYQIVLPLKAKMEDFTGTFRWETEGLAGRARDGRQKGPAEGEQVGGKSSGRAGCRRTCRAPAVPLPPLSRPLPHAAPCSSASVASAA